jgi:uncharacterized membrane protein YhaH (DUF805 family)
MNAISMKEHPFPAFVWGRIREEVKIFFSLSTPINRTRFWIYPIVWFAICSSISWLFLLFLFFLDNRDESILELDRLGYHTYRFLVVQLLLYIPVTIGLIISSIKRLHHIRKPSWIGWGGVLLFYYFPMLIIWYIDEENWLNIFTDKEISTLVSFYACNVARVGLIFFLWLGFFPINLQKMYKYIAKHLMRTR